MIHDSIRKINEKHLVYEERETKNSNTTLMITLKIKNSAAPKVHGYFLEEARCFKVKA